MSAADDARDAHQGYETLLIKFNFYNMDYLHMNFNCRLALYILGGHCVERSIHLCGFHSTATIPTQ